MGRLAVVLGSSAAGDSGKRLVAAAAGGGAEVLLRHGSDRYTLPHRIDHAANLRRLEQAGCDRLLAICSVGSLREEIGIGDLVCPDDFIALQATVTSLDDVRAHRTPGFDREWRDRLLAAAEEAGVEALDGGVYWQTSGPRFETPAEVRLLATHAHLVGMTLGSECAIAGELGLAYAAICVVDNMANGVADLPLSVEELEDHRRRNAERLASALEAIVPRLASTGAPPVLPERRP
jgi:5'-methylthioadenosine phosphorylase